MESEKVGLKLNIQKTKIMASSPITSWGVDGETVEAVSHFIFLELRCRSCLYIFEISCFSVASFAIILSHSEGCFFHLAYSFLCCAEAFKFN